MSGYNYLYADTLFELRKVLARLDSNHIDCYLLCLRILSRIINEFKTNEYAQNAISLYIDCLVAISPKIFKLSVSEKEMYYCEVKNLISIIKAKQEEFGNHHNKGSSDITPMEVDSIEERKNSEGVYYQNIGGKFIPIVPSHNSSRSKSALPY